MCPAWEPHLADVWDGDRELEDRDKSFPPGAGGGGLKVRLSSV